jgi:competence protein ComEC
VLALVLAYNPQLVYSTGFQLSVAAVFGMLLLTRPLKSLVERTLLRPFATPPEQLSNLISVCLAAQIATSPIVPATFEQVSLVGVLTNLIAVPISGPILILGLLGSLAGNIFPLLAYPLNACSGFLVAILIKTAQVSSSLPFASVTTPGVTLLLVGMFCAGCIPPVVAERVFSSEHKSLWAALLLLWSALWLTLVSAGRL